MAVSVEPVHLPKWPIGREAYDRLYAFNQNLDDQMPAGAEWNEIRIKPGLSEEAVYRLLPSAREFEYAGYLTRSRIRFHQGEASSAGMLMAKPCTFHSHPTKNPHLADIPSLKDIHSFLNYRHLRTITVGATKIWVLDKTKSTLATVRRLAVWMERNHFRTVTRLMKRDFATWQIGYVQTAMKDLGWIWPDTFEEMEAVWPTLLRQSLRFKVRIFSRDRGA